MKLRHYQALGVSKFTPILRLNALIVKYTPTQRELFMTQPTNRQDSLITVIDEIGTPLNNGKWVPKMLYKVGVNVKKVTLLEF